jgi:hypothetical protein
MDQNAPKVKTALFLGLGFAISLGGGCMTTRTLSLAPANPAAAVADQGVPCLQSVKKNAVSVWLLTPEYQTDLREFDPPAFRVMIRNNGDTAFDFSLVNVTASSGENSIHVFTREEYSRAIGRQQGSLLHNVDMQTARQMAEEEKRLELITLADPMPAQGANGTLLHNFTQYQNSSSTENLTKIEEAAKDRRTAIYLRQKELLDEANLMLVPHTVAPGATTGGIIKLDPAPISRGQPLKLVVTVGGETHEFVFRAGG